MPDNFVNQSTCDERFDRIIEHIDKTDSKIDKLFDTVSDIKTKFEVLLTDRKYDNEKLIELVNDKRNEPIQRKMDKRYIIGFMATTTFAISGFIIGLLKLILG